MAVAATVGGGLLIWSGLTGAKVTGTLRSLVTGQQPAGQGAVPITASFDAAAAGTALGSVSPGNVGAIPALGTTLPPEATMIKYFGQPGDPGQETWVPFAGKSVQVNKVLAGNVQQLGDQLAAAGYGSYIRDVGGFRTSVGASGSPIPYSMHQFGAAFDINEDGGPNGDWNTMTLPAGLVSICAAAGWFCGQAWGGASRDGGHFQFTGGQG